MTGGKYIKVCGMTDGENIRRVEALGVDFIGFIFYGKSPRCVRGVPSYLPVSAKRVGVFVNAPREEILRRREAFGFDFVQLHGAESPALCRELKEKDGLAVVKAFGIAGGDIGAVVGDYEGVCDHFLFDTSVKGYGGSGMSFDWSLLESYRGETEFLLSGGIGPDSVGALRSFRHPALAGYDLNSRFETAPGLKDPEALEQFLNKLSEYE